MDYAREITRVLWIRFTKRLSGENTEFNIFSIKIILDCLLDAKLIVDPMCI